MRNMSKTPSRLSVKTTKDEQVDFDLGEEKYEVKDVMLDGQKLLQIHDAVQHLEILQEQQRVACCAGRRWKDGIRIYLAVASVVTITMGSYVIHRLNHLPTSMEEIKTLVPKEVRTNALR